MPERREVSRYKECVQGKQKYKECVREVGEEEIQGECVSYIGYDSCPYAYQRLSEKETQKRIMENESETRINWTLTSLPTPSSQVNA